MDKATPTPASVDSVMALAQELGTCAALIAMDNVDMTPKNDPRRQSYRAAYNDKAEALRAEVERLAAQSAPSDQIIELAQALEQKRAIAITDAVHNLPIGGRTANMPTAFQAGYCAACEEIEHRLRTEEWTHCLKPVGAARTDGAISRDSFSGEQLRAAYEVSTARGCRPEKDDSQAGAMPNASGLPAAGNFAEWALVWHDTASAIATIAGGDPNLDPKGMIESVQNAAQSAPLAQQSVQPLDVQLEQIIDDCDGAWHEDVFHIDGPALMCLLRNAYGLADRAAAQAEPQAMPPYSGWVWKHIKSGGEYELIGDAKVQCDDVLTDMAEVYVYRGSDGKLWARPVPEFNKRFERIRPVARQPVAMPPEGVRMLTDTEFESACGRFHDPGKVRSAIRAFCRINAGRVIPADGEVRNG